jgi:hypothetical protein
MFATSRAFAFSAIAASALLGIVLGPRVAAERDMGRVGAEPDCCCDGLTDVPCKTLYCCCGCFCAPHELHGGGNDYKYEVLHPNTECLANNCKGHASSYNMACCCCSTSP